MVQIIEENKPSFSQMIAKGLGGSIGSALQGGLEGHIEKKRAEKENAAFQRATGMDLSGLPAEARQEFVKQFAKSGAQEQLLKKMFPDRFSDYNGEGNDFQSSMNGQRERQNKPFSLSDLGEEERTKLAFINPNLSRQATEEAKIREKREAPERAYEAKKAHDILDKVALSKENLLQRRADYQIAEQQIRQSPGDIGNTKNFLSDAFHLPQLKTASAAAFSSAMKDAFVNSIKQIPGVRPNQWIEQQVQGAMARIGQSDEANLNALAIGNFKLDMEERYNEIVDSLEEQHINKGEKISGSIGKEAYKLMKPYVEERQKELAYDMRVNFEKEKGIKSLEKLQYVTKGTPLTIEMAQILYQKSGENQDDALKMAKNLGYSIPSEDFLRKRGYIE